MITETLKLIPQIDTARLEQMYKTLTDRFAKIAKKFGDGFKFTAKITGPIALVAGLVAKILNPLEKAEGIIERIMNQSGDTSDAAEDLETSTGKLFRLQSIAKAKGVDQDQLRMLLGKFQAALIQERDNASKPLSPETQPGILREFIHERDTAENFFQFMQTVRDLPKDMQVKIQNELFGEKMRGRVQAFLNTPESEIRRLDKDLPASSKLSQAVNKATSISDERDILRSTTETKDFVSKSEIMSMNMATKLDEVTRARNEIDNDALRRFGPASSLELEMLKTQQKVEGMITDLTTKYMPDALKFLQQGTEALEVYGTFFKQELWPGIKKGFEDFGTAISGFQTSLTETFNSIGERVQAAVDSFTGGIRGVADKITGLGETINNWLFKSRGR